MLIVPNRKYKILFDFFINFIIIIFELKLIEFKIYSSQYSTQKIIAEFYIQNKPQRNACKWIIATPHQNLLCKRYYINFLYIY